MIAAAKETKQQNRIALAGELENTQGESYSYHQDFSRISASTLKLFLESRRKYHAICVAKTREPDEAKPHMNLGSVVHSVSLVGTSVKDIVVEYPPFCFSETGRLNGHKAKAIRNILNKVKGRSVSEFYEVIPSDFITPSGAVSKKKAAVEFFEDNKGKFLLSQEEADQLEKAFDGKTDVAEYAMKGSDIEAANAILESLEKHDFAKWCKLDRAIAEEPIFWTHEATGLACRCTPDILVPNCKGARGEFTFFADLKITIAWSQENFRRYLSGRFRGSMRGWVQAAMYMDGVGSMYGPASMRFVCANPEWPHQVRVHPIGEMSFENAREKFEETMKDLAKCYETDDWSDPDEGTDEPVELGPDDLV